MIVNKVRAYILSGVMVLGTSACHNSSKSEKIIQKATTEAGNTAVDTLKLMGEDAKKCFIVKKFKSVKDSITFLKDSSDATINMDKVDSIQDVIKLKAEAAADKKRDLAFKVADAKQYLPSSIYRAEVARAENTWMAETEKACDIHINNGGKAYDSWRSKINKSKKTHCTAEYLKNNHIH